MKIPRMRTVNEIIELVKAEDSESAITANFVRQLCNKALIPFVRAGNKVLIDYDAFLKYLGVWSE